MENKEQIKMQPHQQRVVDEYNELVEKTSKLGAFILDNPIYRSLEEDEQKDMKIQYDAMCVYTDALERRINRF